jgi:hypothetical protein
MKIVDRDQSVSQPAQPSSAFEIRWALGISNLRCQGLYTIWVNCGASVPPPSESAWTILFAPIGWFSHTADNPVRLSYVPLDPPPRDA